MANVKDELPISGPGVAPCQPPLSPGRPPGRRFEVEGLCCAAEARQIDASLGSHPQVRSLRIDPVRRLVIVDGPVPASEVERAVADHQPVDRQHAAAPRAERDATRRDAGVVGPDREPGAEQSDELDAQGALQQGTYRQVGIDTLRAHQHDAVSAELEVVHRRAPEDRVDRYDVKSDVVVAGPLRPTS